MVTSSSRRPKGGPLPFSGTVALAVCLYVLSMCVVVVDGFGLNPRGPGRTLVLVRHGESAWNKENKFTGWYDAPLSST
jgi:hypothetical protein